MFREEIGKPSIARFISGQKPLAFYSDIPLAKETTKVVNGHMVDIGRVIPAMGKLLRHGHASAKHMGQTHAPLCEIGEGDKGLPSDPYQVIQHEIRPFGGLQRLA